MNDRRLAIFRTLTLGLIESLQAVVRLSRWDDADAPPDPLIQAREKLTERLGAVDRMVSSKFNGSPADTARVATFCEAMKRLDAAYLTYRQESDSSVPAKAAAATEALEQEVGAVANGLAELSDR